MKNFIFSIVAVLLFAYIAPGVAKAKELESHNETLFNENNLTEVITENSIEEVTEINSDEANQVFEEAVEDVSDVVETVAVVDDTETVVETKIESEDISADGSLLIDNETNEITFDFATEDENGEVIEQTYRVILNSISEEDFNATLINVETGEVLEVDSTQLQASVIPVVAVLVGFLVRWGISWVIKQFGKAALKSAVKDIGKKIAKKSLGKGTTGRQVANDLVEEIFMEHVLSNPLDGATELKSIKLSDKRWHHSDGWVKMERKLKTKEGQNVVIHFVYNKKTKKFDDFKYK